jgi:hypothetical protein
VKKSFPHPTVIVVREPGGDERGQHRRVETLTEDSALSPQREAGCFFPPDPWNEDCLMMPIPPWAGHLAPEPGKAMECCFKPCNLEQEISFHTFREVGEIGKLFSE